MFKKKKAANSPKPRSLEECSKEYSELCNHAGQLQYQIEVYKEDLSRINRRLLAVNQEAAQLKAQEASQPKTEESKS